MFFSAHRRARAWLYLSILRSLRGNAEKKRGEWRAGKKASVVVVFSIGVESKRMVSPFLLAFPALIVPPLVVLFTLSEARALSLRLIG